MPKKAQLECPVCHNPGSLVIMGRYRYVSHWHRESKRARLCYLGPMEYIHGSGLQPFRLRGKGDSARILGYLRELIDSPEFLELSNHQAKMALEILERGVELLRSKLETESLRNNLG